MKIFFMLFILILNKYFSCATILTIKLKRSNISFSLLLLHHFLSLIVAVVFRTLYYLRLELLFFLFVFFLFYGNQKNKLQKEESCVSVLDKNRQEERFHTQTSCFDSLTISIIAHVNNLVSLSSLCLVQLFIFPLILFQLFYLFMCVCVCV